MLRPERQHQAVFGGRRLQLEVELAAEALAERQPPRLGDPAAEGRVQDELHAARLVEESLEDERLLRGDDAEHATSSAEIADSLLRRRGRHARFLGEPGRRSTERRGRSRARVGSEPGVDFGPQIAHRA